MKPATVHQIKKELEHLDAKKMTAIILRLAKYKKENKELLSYLLFEAEDEQEYIKGVKEEVAHQFGSIASRNLYYAKKSLRKILRYLDRFIKYSGNKETETELRIYFCALIKDSWLPLHRSQVLQNLYDRQLKKIDSAVAKLHEDLQADYHEQIEELK